MATSSALSTSNKYVKYQITVTEGTPNEESNYSPVTVSVKFYRTNTGYTTYGTGTVYCKINGTTYSEAVTTSDKITNEGIVLFTKTLNITHDDDGGKTLSVTAWIDHSVLTSSEQGFSVELTTIARASQPSCVTWPEHTQDVGNFGDTISIHMNRKSDSFTHRVYYMYGTMSGTIASNVTTGTTWEIPLSFMRKIPNDTSGSGWIYVETYQGATDPMGKEPIGVKRCGFTATVPDWVKPTCSIQVLDATDTKDKYGNLVQGLSKLQIKVTGTAAYESPINSYDTWVDSIDTKDFNLKYYAGANFTTDALPLGGTVTVSSTVKDARGRTSAAAEASFPVLAYVKPAVTALSVHRCDAEGNEDDQGEYVITTFSAAVTPLNNKNSAAYTLRYKKSSDDNYTEVKLTDLAGDYQVTDYSYIFAADSDYSYDVEVEAKDDIEPVTRATSASTAFTLMDWNDDGKSIAFGKVSEESGALENALTLKQIGNRYAFSTPGIANQAGIVCLARIQIIAANADTPITFVLSRRQAESTMTVHVQFSNPTATTSSVKSIRYEGSNYGAYLTPGGDELTWDLYVTKGSAWDTITLQDWYTSRTMQSRVKVTFPGGIVDTVPTPFWRAGPLIAESILDCFFPVGFVLILYSKADPNTMYPGSTWVRIENAFLWGCDEDGDIGVTGGERTHTLAVSELPSHTHGIDVAHEPTGGIDMTTDEIIYRNNAGTTSYEGNIASNAAGGGAAHNNMPPYIQVAIWRRTA